MFYNWNYVGMQIGGYSMPLLVDKDYPVSYHGEQVYKVHVEVATFSFPWDAETTAERVADQLIEEARKQGIEIMHVKVWIDSTIPTLYNVTVEYLGFSRKVGTTAIPGAAIVIAALVALGIVIYFIIKEIKTPIYDLPPWTPLNPADCEKAGAVYDAKLNKCIPRGKTQDPLVTIAILILFAILATQIIQAMKR